MAEELTRPPGQYYVRKGGTWFVGKFKPDGIGYPWTLPHDTDRFATSYFDEIGEPIPTRDELRELTSLLRQATSTIMHTRDDHQQDLCPTCKALAILQRKAAP